MTKRCRVNDFYFSEINTEGKAYFLGLIYADGNMSSRRPAVILSSKDRELLEKYSTAIGSTYKICREFHKVFEKECFKVSISSKQMFSDLLKLGCHPRKSLTKTFPTAIPEPLLRHFIRGYFDGNGSVGVYNNSSKKQCPIIRSGFSSGSLSFLTTLVQHLNIFNKTIKSITVNKHVIPFSSADSYFLYSYMYKDATVWLARKKDIFDKIIKQNPNSVMRIGVYNNGEKVGEYKSVVEAATTLNMKRSRISMALLENRPCKNGFSFKYSNVCIPTL